MAISGFVFYHYDPSLVGAIVFATLFFISSLWHTVKIIRTQSWFFIPFLIGAILLTVLPLNFQVEFSGYIGRILSHFNKEALNPFLIQALLLLLAPALFAASIYMILGRLISLVDAEKYSIIKILWLTKLFVFGDVLSFAAQSVGGAMMSRNSASSVDNGQKMVVVGLFIQIIFFGFFIVVSVIFHKRIHHSPTYTSQTLKLTSNSSRMSWEGLLYALYASSGAILVRSIFRVIEYIQGNSGYLMRNEVWLYIFDGFLMILVVAVFIWVHPSGVLRREVANTENPEGTEMEECCRDLQD